MKWFIENPITVWIAKLFIAKKLEFKYRKEKLKIGYLSYAKKSSFGLYNTLQDNVSLYEVQLNDFSYISFGSSVARTNIGKFCSIGPDCKIGLGNHPAKSFVSTHPIFFSSTKRAQLTFADKNYFKETDLITIGNDVWIGANVVVTDGVNIENGVIVGSGSVVTKDIPSYAIVGGVPAKIIRYRFEDNEIEQLLDLKWWDMDIKYLKNNFKDFHDIKKFLKND